MQVVQTNDVNEILLSGLKVKSVKKSDGSTSIHQISSSDPVFGSGLEAGLPALLNPENYMVKNVARVLADDVSGDVFRFRSITGVTGGSRIALGHVGARGSTIGFQVDDLQQKFAQVGLTSVVTTEVNALARGYADLNERAAFVLMPALQEGQERMHLYGNNAVQLGTTPTPTATAVVGGAVTAKAWSIICVALNHQAWTDATIATGVVPTYEETVPYMSTTRTRKSGAAIKSARCSVTTAAAGSIQLALPSAVKGAVAYAWYAGTSGAEKLTAITTTNRYLMTADPAGTQLIADLGATADDSFSGDEYNGAYTQMIQDGSRSIVSTLDGATQLTGNGNGRIDVIDAMLERFRAMYRISPDTMLMSPKTAAAYQYAVQNRGTGASNFVTMLPSFGGGADAAAQVNNSPALAGYANWFKGQKIIKAVVHNMVPDGQILFMTFGQLADFLINEVGMAMQVAVKQPYTVTPYAQVNQTVDRGLSAIEAFVLRIPAAFGALTNIEV